MKQEVHVEFLPRFRKTVMVTLLATGIVHANAWAGCEGLFKYGIYDIGAKTNDMDRTLSFREWFCQREFPAKNDAVGVLNAIAVPPETVPVKLGAQDNDSDFKESYAAFCSDANMNSASNQGLSRNLRNIHQSVIQNFTTCTSAVGLHAWIQQGKEPGRFSLNFLYPKTTPKPATVITITRFNITCDNLRLPFDISGEKSFACTRRDPRGQSSLWVLASEPVVEGNSYNVGKTTYTLPVPQANGK